MNVRASRLVSILGRGILMKYNFPMISPSSVPFYFVFQWSGLEQWSMCGFIVKQRNTDLASILSGRNDSLPVCMMITGEFATYENGHTDGAEHRGRSGESN